MPSRGVNRLRRRKIKFSLIVVVTMGLLIGCSGNKTNIDLKAEGTNKISNTDEVTLKFWRNSGNDAENAAFDQLVTLFMENNPDIHVIMSPIPYSDYDTKLRTSIASGDPPDVCLLYTSDAADE